MSEHKPFVLPINAIENDIPVNLSFIVTFAKQDKQDVKNNKFEYCIVFYKSEVAHEGQKIVWRYSDETCRDSDFESLKQNFSVPLGS